MSVLETLTPVQAKCFAEFLTHHGDPSYNVNLLLQEGITAIIVAADAMLIGLMILRSSTHGGVHLCALCVDSSWRNQGVATRMLERLKKIHSKTELTLNVLCSSPHLIAFYGRRGFACSELNVGSQEEEPFISMTARVQVLP